MQAETQVSRQKTLSGTREHHPGSNSSPGCSYMAAYNAKQISSRKISLMLLVIFVRGTWDCGAFAVLLPLFSVLLAASGRPSEIGCHRTRPAPSPQAGNSVDGSLDTFILLCCWQLWKRRNVGLFSGRRSCPPQPSPIGGDSYDDWALLCWAVHGSSALSASRIGGETGIAAERDCDRTYPI